MWVSSWATVVVNQREGFQQFVALPYVHSVHEQYVKLHEQHYRTYIQMIDFQMSQNSMQQPAQFLCTNVYNMIYTQLVMWRYLLYS